MFHMAKSPKKQANNIRQRTTIQWMSAISYHHLWRQTRTSSSTSQYNQQQQQQKVMKFFSTKRISSFSQTRKTPQFISLVLVQKYPQVEVNTTISHLSSIVPVWLRVRMWEEIQLTQESQTLKHPHSDRVTSSNQKGRFNCRVGDKLLEGSNSQVTRSASNFQISWNRFR